MAGTVKRIFREAMADNLTGESAKVAYYLFLALFPTILTILALTGFLGGQDTFTWIMSRMRGTLAPDTTAFLERFVREVTSSREAGALGIGIVLTMWAASGGFAALADGLNTVYDLEEGRSWWKKRAVALAILVASTILLIVGATAIIAGPELGAAIGLGAVWNVLRWPLAFALLASLMWLAYRFLPNRSRRPGTTDTLIGAVAGALVWLGVTALFRLYVTRFGSYGETYGLVGAVIVLMLWLYLTALSILFGGEIAATLEGRHLRRAGAPG